MSACPGLRPRVRRKGLVSNGLLLGRSGRMTLWCSKKRIHWMHRLLRENWDRRNGEFAVARNFGLLLCPRVVATTS